MILSFPNKNTKKYKVRKIKKKKLLNKYVKSRMR